MKRCSAASAGPPTSLASPRRRATTDSSPAASDRERALDDRRLAVEDDAGDLRVAHGRPCARNSSDRHVASVPGVSDSRVRTYARKARRAAGLARRRLGGASAERLAASEAEVRKLKRKLKATRTELREVRGELEHARGDSHSLPPAVEEAIARAREEHLTYLKADNLRALAAVVLDARERRAGPGS